MSPLLQTFRGVHLVETVKATDKAAEKTAKIEVRTTSCTIAWRRFSREYVQYPPRELMAGLLQAPNANGQRGLLSDLRRGCTIGRLVGVAVQG